MKTEMKLMLVGLVAVGAVGVCILRVGLAQTAATTQPAAAAQPGDAELDQILQQGNAPQGNARQGNVPIYGTRQSSGRPAGATSAATRTFPSAETDSRVAPARSELRQLLDEASRIVQSVNGDQPATTAATRLREIVERVRELDTSAPNHPLASDRERNSNAPVIDSQRLEELKKHIDALQAAQTRMARAAATQALLGAVERAKFDATRATMQGAPAQSRPTTTPASNEVAQNPADFRVYPATPAPAYSTAVGQNPFGASAIPLNETGRYAAAAGAQGGPGLEWKRTASAFELQIRQASERMRNTTEDSKKAEAKKQLSDLLNQYFDQETERRAQELASIEERVKNLRAQLTKRREKKQELIDLQLKVAENEADGLGFFSNPNDPQGQQFFEAFGPPQSPAANPLAPAISLPHQLSAPRASGASRTIRRQPAQQAATDDLDAKGPPAGGATSGGFDDLFPPAGGGRQESDPFK